ncbi:MAG: DUF814 domain-containing protein [Bacteroidetes bacterium]|nr:MAG: DUF814 domain-containing protein [Bacteroidota bacterium]
MAIKNSLHQHYHFITQLAYELQHKLNEATCLGAFTLSKQELIICFSKNNHPFNIKVIAKFQSGFLLFDETPFNKGSNAQACFEGATNKIVTAVQSHHYNRSFSIVFNNNTQIIIKCYEALINAVLVEQNKVTDVFRESITNDWEYNPNEFNVTNQTLIDKINQVSWSNNQFLVVRQQSELLLRPQATNNDEVIYQTNSPIEASSFFAKNTLTMLGFNQTKNSAIASLQGEIKKINQLINTTQQSLESLKNNSPFEEIGHLIMANLYQLQKGQEQAELFDFYNNQTITVKLKSTLSPAENAAYFYRKAKNKKIEIEQLELKIHSTKQKLAMLEQKLTQLQQAKEPKQLKTYTKQNKQEPPFPFKKFHVEEFEIWVGKNALNNDLLTQKYAHKNDLWLHAKDVSGSHVIIKHKAGKIISNTLITTAAAIAAYYSKHKGNALAPVSYTPKKFVRKPKGFEPGQVVIDREEVIMVEPGLPKT